MICFFKSGLFSNFYNCNIIIDDKKYTTVEHYFQAMKSTNVHDHEKVRVQRTPFDAKRMGRTISLRKDWEDIKIDIMYKALKTKFSYPIFKTKLLNTNNDELIEASPYDSFWGAGKDERYINEYKKYEGQNMTGKLLMKLREEFRKEGP